jgi:hypothetical protein
MVKFYIGLDLGQANDYTALNVMGKIENKDGNIYHVSRLERIRGESYPNIAKKVNALMASPALAGRTDLVVDQTGVGAPVVDLLREAGLKPIAVSIHGGAVVSREGNNWKVPKRDLVGTMQVLLQSGRFKVAKRLKLGPTLQAELLNFKVKIDPVTAHDSYSAWRDNEHDDLVLSAALAAWWAERQPKPIGPLVFGGATKTPARIPGGAGPSSNWVAQASDDMIRAAHKQSSR